MDYVANGGLSIFSIDKDSVGLFCGLAVMRTRLYRVGFLAAVSIEHELGLPVCRITDNILPPKHDCSRQTNHKLTTVRILGAIQNLQPKETCEVVEGEITGQFLEKLIFDFVELIIELSAAVLASNELAIPQLVDMSMDVFV